MPIQVGTRFCLLNLDFRPINFQFIGEDHRQRGLNALADFGFRDDELNAVVFADVDPGIERIDRSWFRRWTRNRRRGHKVMPQREADYECCAARGHS